MNKHLFLFLWFTVTAILLFVWDSYKIKHKKYDIPVHTDWWYGGVWRWVYNWGWMTVGMAVNEFNKFVGLTSD